MFSCIPVNAPGVVAPENRHLYDKTIYTLPSWPWTFGYHTTTLFTSQAVTERGAYFERVLYWKKVSDHEATF